MQVWRCRCGESGRLETAKLVRSRRLLVIDSAMMAVDFAIEPHASCICRIIKHSDDNKQKQYNHYNDSPAIWISW